MKRVSIIGCPGSGKSYFAQLLHEKTRLPLVHLDKLYHPLKTSFSFDHEENRKIWATVLGRILKEHSWITDGNYFSTQNLRLAASDTVIVFDFPKRIVYWRLIKRRLMYRKVKRPDMPDSWKESLKLSFLKSHVLGFNQKFQDITKPILSDLEGEVEIIIFRHPREVEKYLINIS